jgi:nanoRNase/pAp phosphatase (c-di-AMP/oligoRNAs hydrolase)
LFAGELGGGGHRVAAGFSLEKMDLDKAEKRVLEVIEKVGAHYF